ncbi:ABC transporter, oligopeptide binding protein [Rivularia sp. IAM M-261]|nr:ABC transporter, oligopeptide binding protein [Calothrix sp. PCC 7716]GJD22166.1 ABC transporter, oligopeptide binding protein [Rivularia sp. IAM M-261]
MIILNKFMTSRIFSLLLTSVLLTSCSDPNAEKGNTIRLLYWQAPTILNPHLAWGAKDFEASRISYEPLASFNQDSKLILFLGAEIPTLENGGLAKDGKSVTWKLKQGIKWSDGKPFTAADVVFTYKYISNPAVAATTSGIYKDVQSVEAINDYTVKINFRAPNPAWSLPFIGESGLILPNHIFEKYNGANAREAPANRLTVGTGAYRVVQFKPGDIVIYEPNPLFRSADKVKFQRVEIKGGGDAASAARAVLQTQSADYAWNLQVEAKVLKQLSLAGKGKLNNVFGSFVERIMFNQTDPKFGSSVQFPHPFFSDKKVRQAFSYAVDRETIAKQLFGDIARPVANVLTAPEIYNSPNTTYEFNVKKAAALLDEAGWKDTNENGIRDKNGVEMNVLFQTSANPVRQKIQEIVKQGLTSIGVKVDLKSIDPSIFFSGDPNNPDTTSRFQADMQLFSDNNNNPDPSISMKSWTCSEIAQKENNWSKNNFSRYCNPEYDKLWQQSTTELNLARRRQLFIQMNDILIKDAVVLPLVTRARVIATSNNLSGVEFTPWDANTWNIHEWQKK